jgi:hypothetical protein
MSEPLQPSVTILNRRGRVFKMNGTVLYTSLRTAIEKARELVGGNDHRILYGEDNTYHTLDQFDVEALIARADPPPPPVRQNRQVDTMAHQV